MTTTNEQRTERRNAYRVARYYEYETTNERAVERAADYADGLRDVLDAVARHGTARVVHAHVCDCERN